MLRWLKCYVAEGPDGLRGVPLSGFLSEVARVYRPKPITAVRLRPPRLGLRFFLRTLLLLVEDLAELTGIQISDGTACRALQ